MITTILSLAVRSPSIGIDEYIRTYNCDGRMRRLSGHSNTFDEKVD